VLVEQDSAEPYLSKKTLPAVRGLILVEIIAVCLITYGVIVMVAVV
jgi:hypothetical protein